MGGFLCGGSGRGTRPHLKAIRYTIIIWFTRSNEAVLKIVSKMYVTGLNGDLLGALITVAYFFLVGHSCFEELVA